MKVIQKTASAAEKILGRQTGNSAADVRFLTYCAAVSCEDGILLHNVMTKEMLLLEPEDLDDKGICLINPDHLYASELLKRTGSRLRRYLFEHWYLVPVENDDKELCLSLRSIAKHLQKMNAPKGFIAYTILTTTDCNARCFYCYEKDTKRENMSRETALKTAEFISRNYESFQQTSKRGNRKRSVSLQWFGGEPLFNMGVIDLITEELAKQGIPYRSSMISNGYLFDDGVVDRAVKKWKLRHVQITLDGTEEVYNRSKAYIYPEGNPYIRVTDNIERLLRAGIPVTVRLNLDDRNFEDLGELSDELISRFSGYGKFRVYATYLFKMNPEGINGPYRGDLEVLCGQMLQLQTKLRNAGVQARNRLKKSVRTNKCMADNDASVLIQADGSLGRCEHHYDSMPCGSVECGITDPEAAAYWKRQEADEKVCESCPCYPDCIRLTGCQSAYTSACQQVPAMRADILPSLRRDMLGSYEMEKQKITNGR